MSRLQKFSKNITCIKIQTTTQRIYNIHLQYTCHKIQVHQYIKSPNPDKWVKSQQHKHIQNEHND